MSKWLVQARGVTAVWGRLKNDCDVRMRLLMPAPPTHAHPFRRLHFICSLKSAKHHPSEDGKVRLTYHERLAPCHLCSRRNPPYQISSRGRWSWSGLTCLGSSAAEKRRCDMLSCVCWMPLPASPTQVTSALLPLTSMALALRHPMGWLLPHGDQEKGHDHRPTLDSASALRVPHRKTSLRGLPVLLHHQETTNQGD